jgi:aspartate aminotransferase
LFERLSLLKHDTILGLMAQYRADPATRKVDLGVGVFRDLSGNTPILESVRRAERLVLADQTTKSYVAAAGREEFNEAALDLVLGAARAAVGSSRLRVVQAPGGCGALRVGAELLRAASAGACVHVSDPTWGNHAPLLGSSGLRLETYPYYAVAAHRLRFGETLERLELAAPGDVVVLHACCHNPTGADLAPAEWRELAALLVRRRLLPFIDLAYQGFGDGLDADAFGLRHVATVVPELLIAVSFSKNLGLYRERLGALIVLAESEAAATAANSHVLQIARGIYSMPPDHGAAIAARIFADAGLREQWLAELAAMRERIHAMRKLLSEALRRTTGTQEFDFLGDQRGMFSQLGCSSAAVARLREEHHIYMLGNGRMNLAGLLPEDAAYVAESIATVLGAERAA